MELDTKWLLAIKKFKKAKQNKTKQNVLPQLFCCNVPTRNKSYKHFRDNHDFIIKIMTKISLRPKNDDIFFMVL